MGKHNLVLWLDYTEEATTYHALDMSMWGAVRYRRTFSYDDCNMVQYIGIDHKYSPSTYRTKMPIHSGKGFFSEFWYDHSRSGYYTLVVRQLCRLHCSGQLCVLNCPTWMRWP